jgi:hypothetical protein
VRRRGLVLPLVLISIGALALLGNLGYVSTDSVLRLFELWPVILILVGAEMVIRSGLTPSRAEPVRLALMVVALAGSVAYAVSAPPIPRGEQVLDSSAGLQGVEQATLDLSFGASDVNVHAAPLGRDAYRAHITYEGADRPTVTFDSRSGVLHISSDPGPRVGFLLFGGHRSIDLTLSDQVPWKVQVAGGASNATIDLGQGRVSSVDVSGGASHIKMVLPRPSGTVKVDVSGGASNVEITRPAGIPVLVDVSGGASSLSVDGVSRAFIGDNTVRSPEYDSATDRYDVSVSGGASRVSVSAV